MKKLCMVLMGLLLLMSFGMADYLVKTNSHTDAMEMMGQKQPAKDTMTENWFGDQYVVNVNDNQRTVLDLDKKKMYIINDSEKNYVETDIPVDLEKLLPPEAREMMSMMKGKVEIEKTGETKEISGYSCTLYKVELTMMMTIKMDMWVTRDVPFDYKKMQALMQNMGNMRYIENKEDFKKIDGYPILTHVNINMMGTDIKSYQEVVSIEQKAIPAEKTNIPSDYTKKENLGMQDLRK